MIRIILLFMFLVPAAGLFVQLFLMVTTLYEDKEIEEDWLYKKLRVNKIRLNLVKFIVMYLGYCILAIFLPIFLLALILMLLELLFWLCQIKWSPMKWLSKTLSKLG